MKKSHLSVLSLILISCSDKYFTLDAEEWVLPESFVEIDHEPLNLNIMGSNDLIIYTLMFVITSNPMDIYMFSAQTQNVC